LEEFPRDEAAWNLLASALTVREPGLGGPEARGSRKGYCLRPELLNNSEESILAKWVCPDDGSLLAANLRPACPRCHQPMRFLDLADATRASRSLLAELVDGDPYEPRFVGYVRIDPPLPAMHRQVPDGTIQRDIRRLVFPAD